jgi:hypothetical protein
MCSSTYELTAPTARAVVVGRTHPGGILRLDPPKFQILGPIVVTLTVPMMNSLAGQ